ncbi:MAG: outer membrane beta-barrel protein [Thermoanaerobaculia bacterium]
MSRNVWIFAIVCVLISGSALAGELSGIEITPTIGYRWSGDFDHLSMEGTPGEIALDDAEEYGLILSFPVTKRVDVEFRWTQQSADLESAFANDATPPDLKSDSYLAGVAVFFPVESKAIKPYVNFELGVTQFDVSDEFSSQSAFAYAIGGGSKFYLGERFGIRVQGSYLSSNIPGGRDIFCSANGTCFSGTSRNSVSQLELTGGFIFRF